MKSSRRAFLKSAGLAATALATSPLAQGAGTPGKSEVYVGKGDAAEMIPKMIAKMGGMGRFVKPGARVLIKPNMSFGNPPEWGSDTSPGAVLAVVKLCLEAGAKRVVVCDNTLSEPELCKEKTGIGPALKGMKGVVLFTPKQDAMFVAKTSDKATELRSTAIVKELDVTDTFISLPTAKSHSAGGVSLGIKGLMGLIKDRGTMHSDMDLHKAIAEQLYYMKPHLSIIDASRALLDNGPRGPGRVQETKAFVAGVDPVAVDAFGVSLASWYGKSFEGKQVQHLKWAAELGFGNVESGSITEIAV